MKEQPVIAVIGAGCAGRHVRPAHDADTWPAACILCCGCTACSRYAAQSFTCNGAACTFLLCDTAAGAAARAGGLRRQKYRACPPPIETMRPFIGPETLVISLLNGITSEGELAAAYGPEHVLYCVAQGMDAVKDGPAVTYRNMGKLLIGSGTGARTSAVDAAAALLLEAGVPAKYMKIFCTASGAS